MRSGIIALAALLGTAAAAQAGDTLSGGAIFGGPAQAIAVCYVYNSGTKPLGLLGTRLTDTNGVILPLFVSQCGSTLAAGKACSIAANIAGNQVYSCATVVSPSKANARGILEVRDSDFRTLQNIELR